MVWYFERVVAELKSINARLAQIDGQLGFKSCLHQELENIERAIRNDNQAPGQQA